MYTEQSEANVPVGYMVDPSQQQHFDAAIK